MAEIRVEELLKWPEEKQRPAGSRDNSRFKVGSFKTEQFLRDELHKINARNIIMRTFHEERFHRRDGGIRVDARAPSHPGVILEFEKPIRKEGETHFLKMRLPCDTYRFWEDNLRAIAMVLEGLRMIDRHQVSAGAQYQGYLALPPKPGHMTVEDAAAFLAKHGGVDGSEGALLKHSIFSETAYKTAAKQMHPDKGGDPQQFAMLEKAMSLIREHFAGDKTTRDNVVEGKFKAANE